MLTKGYHLCLSCIKKVITWQFAICTECEHKYGTSPYDWPEWLRFLWKDEQRRRRQQKKIRKFEINVSLSDIREYDNGKISRQYPEI